MPDLTITGHVTRPIVGGGNLSLNTATYTIMGREDSFGPGEMVWSRQYVEAPYVHGRYLVNARKEQLTTPLGIRVTGSSETDCFNKVSTLIAAFEQIEYELSITIEGTTFTYTCEPADWTVGRGGSIDELFLISYKQEVRFLIPHMPLPVAGPF